MLNIFPISYPKDIALSEITIIRHASFPIVPRVMKNARSWRRLESLVGVLTLRKFDKIRNFHRKKVCAHPICKTRTAIIKFQKYSIQKP